MWRTSLALASLIALSSGISTIAFTFRAPAHQLPMAIVTVASLLTFLFLLASGSRTQPLKSVGLFFWSTALILIGVWVNHTLFFRAGRPFEPFIGNKVLALSIGLIAPPFLWVGMTTILAAGILPVIQYLLLDEAVRHALPVQEPWITCICVLIAVITYIYRLKWYETQLRAAQNEEKARMIQQFAHLLINAQHLANTPLQTIENTVAILKAQHPEQQKLTAPMERSLTRIREVMQLFSYCDSHINWEEMELPRTLEAFEKRMKELVDQNGDQNAQDSKEI